MRSRTQKWHIISRNCTDAFVDRVYKCFGFLRIANGAVTQFLLLPVILTATVSLFHLFSLAGPMSYPEELSPLRFTNPDALYISHYISVRVDEEEGGHTLPVAPMVYLRPYDVSDEHENPFDNIAVAWYGPLCGWLLL